MSLRRVNAKDVKAKRLRLAKQKADRAWFEAVKRRDKGMCQLCGTKEGTMNSHHWYVRKAKSSALRWDIRNGVLLCYACHIWHIHFYADYAVLKKYIRMLDEKFKGNERELMNRILESPKKDYTEEEVLSTQRNLDGLYK